jgi:hypothetical protein
MRDDKILQYYCLRVAFVHPPPPCPLDKVIIIVGGLIADRTSGVNKISMVQVQQSQAPPPSKDLSSSQLRNRRNQIIRDKAQEDHDHRVFNDHVTHAVTSQSKTLLVRLYVVVGTALIVTVVAGLNQFRPRFLFNRKKSRPFYLGTLYPTNVVLERDLPLFFRTFSIATPENKAARLAVKKVAKSRSNLKEPGTKVILKAWDEFHIRRLMQRNTCGEEFAEAYTLASTNFERQQDLLMWCLLAARVVEGFFSNDVDVMESPIVFKKNRGVIALKPEQPRISSSFFVVPRSTKEATMVSMLPYNVFMWVVANDEANYESRDQYQQALEEFIYEQVAIEGMDQFMALDMDCENPDSKRTIARHCKAIAANKDTSRCCEFLLPRSEGGNLHGDDDDNKKNQSGEKLKPYLRR